MHYRNKIKLFVLSDIEKFEDTVNEFIEHHHIIKLFSMGINNDVLVVQYREEGY